MGKMSDSPDINVQRRRKGSKPVRQATAPNRRPPSGQTASSIPPSSAPVGSSSSGLTGSPILRSTGGKMGCGGILLIGLVIILFLIFNQGGEYVETPSYAPEEPNTYAEPINVQPTRTPPSSASESDQKWLVMVYQDADDQVLEQDIFIDLNEMERIGSTDQVMIVTQLDRFRGGYSGDENWHSTRRYLVTYDDNLNAIGSELLQDLGEVNMANGDSLVDFATWAIESFPADRHVLIMSDHGMGWPGGWSDPAPGARDGGSAPLINQLQGDSIYLAELDEALDEITQATGIGKFDLIGLDACLMSQLEVYSALQPYANYAVASEETEPGLGWAYSAFLSLLVYDPSIETAQLAANIVETYIDQDERITDDQARMEFLQQNSSSGGFFGPVRVSADQLARQLEQNITLTAVDLNALPDLHKAFNAFAFSLQSINQQAVANARNYTQSYTSIFGRQVPPSYMDLGHFVQLVAKQSGNTAIRQAANNVLGALNSVVIAERHGSTKPGSTGIAFYFPNSTLYKTPATGMQSYTMIANRFSRVSLWDDFLVYHYSNRSFRADSVEPVTPSVSSITRAPGAGTINISNISASANSVSPGSSIRLSAEISGDNIGYIYLFTGLYHAQTNSIYVADSDYLESPETDSLNGVYYPAWPDSDSFTMNFEFEPLLFTITDGDQSALALFNPVSYGASAENAIYAVEGTYTFSDTGEQRKAELLFMDGNLYQVYGFYGNDTAGAPSEITTSFGDTFTISNKWLELDSSGNISQVIYEDGDTVTFTDKPLIWEQVYAPSGEYLIGFLVSDLDGNLNQAYTKIIVR